MLDLTTLKKIGTIERYGQDDAVFLQGEKGDAMYIILQGSVEIIVNSEFDGAENQIAVLKSGDTFGEMSIIQNEVRMATVRTLENSALFRIGQENFEAFISKKPEMIESMMRMLAQRILIVEGKIEEACGDKEVGCDDE